jgi:hypothetical protein
LQQAKVLLNGATEASTKHAAGRPKKKAFAARILSFTSVKRVVSAEAKAKMAEAQAARWAKARRAAKKAGKTVATAKAIKPAAPIMF